MRRSLLVCGCFLSFFTLSLSVVAAQRETREVSKLPSVTIVFDSGGDIYTSDFEHPAVKLTDGTTWDVMPFWSPDGREIAFLRSPSELSGEYHVTVLTLATGHIRQFGDLVLTEENQLSWSHDGRHILVALNALYSVDTRSGAMQQLTADGTSSQYASGSPDGTYVVFYANDVIERIDLDGRNLQSLTPASTRANSQSSPRESVQMFSPAGDQILYFARGEEGTVLYTTNVTDGTQTMIRALLGYNADRVEWSSDGRYIAFDGGLSTRSPVAIPSNFNVYVLRSDGSHMHPVSGNGDDCLIGWLPNSESLLYWAQNPGSADGTFYAVNVISGMQIHMSDLALDEVFAYRYCPFAAIRPAG